MISIIGAMRPQVKEVAEAKRETWNGSFSSAPRGDMALLASWSQSSRH